MLASAAMSLRFRAFTTFFLLVLTSLLTSASFAMTCESMFSPTTAAIEVHSLRRLTADRAAMEDLRRFLPGATTRSLQKLIEKLERGLPLDKGVRLQIALIRLAQDSHPIHTGQAALQRLAAVMEQTEIDFIPEGIHQLWQSQSGSSDSRTTFVRHAFRVYNYANKAGVYDEHQHPSAFSYVLKPPARRYGRDDVFSNLEIITQLDHITIINQRTGAIEIQRIDPNLRRFAPEGPLVFAVLQYPDYLKTLSIRHDLVIFRKPGKSGAGVWVF